MSNGGTFYIPDTMASWPWKRTVNPHYSEAVAAETRTWIQSFDALPPEIVNAWDKSDTSLLAALTWPWASRAHLKTGCELVSLFFIIDAYTDVVPASVVRQRVDMVSDALNNPRKPRPEGELVLGEVARQFWERGMTTATPTAQKHMLESFEAYLESVVRQATERDNNTISTIDDYLRNRRDNIGLKPCLAIAELDLNLVDDVFYHPIIVELSGYCAEFVALDNDMTSYSKEQACGDDRYNIITIAMHRFNIELDDAMRWTASYHMELQERFLESWKRLPSWGATMDRQVWQYLLTVAQWPCGNYYWHFECGRYFGSKGKEILETRVAPLYPKVAPSTQDTSIGQEFPSIPDVDELEKGMS